MANIFLNYTIDALSEKKRLQVARFLNIKPCLAYRLFYKFGSKTIIRERLSIEPPIYGFIKRLHLPFLLTMLSNFDKSSHKHDI